MPSVFLLISKWGELVVSESKGSFSKWKDKINKKVNTLGSKTSYAMDRAKVRKQITHIQEEIALLKQEIGNIVHKNRNNNFTLELVEAQFVQIEEKEISIVELEVHIDELNELSRLAGLEVEEETVSVKETFSRERLGNEKEAATNHPLICSKCKHSYEEPKKFCEMCGHKMVG